MSYVGSPKKINRKVYHQDAVSHDVSVDVSVAVSNCLASIWGLLSINMHAYTYIYIYRYYIYICVCNYVYIYIIHTHAYSNKDNCTPSPKKKIFTVAHDDPYQTNILETPSFDPFGDHCIIPTICRRLPSFLPWRGNHEFRNSNNVLLVKTDGPGAGIPHVIIYLLLKG